MSIDYKKEFFDRAYTVREAYGRLWRYARKYRFRLVVGIVCGMLTAGTLVPASIASSATCRIWYNPPYDSLQQTSHDRDGDGVHPPGGRGRQDLG